MVSALKWERNKKIGKRKQQNLTYLPQVIFSTGTLEILLYIWHVVTIMVALKPSTALN